MSVANAYLIFGFGLQAKLHSYEQEAASGAEGMISARRKLDDDWPHVVGVSQWCVRKRASDKRAAILLSKLAGTAGTLLFSYLPIHEQIHWREEAYASARLAGLANDEIGHGAQLAYLLFTVGNIDKAHALIDELLERNDTLVDSPGDALLTGQSEFPRPQEERDSARATLLSHRGMFLTAHGRDGEALPPLLEAVAWFRAHDSGALPLSLNTLAVVQGHLGKNEEALFAADEAIAAGDSRVLADALINRGGFLESLGRNEDALESVRQGAIAAQRAGGLSAIALASVQLGLWYIRHGTPAEQSEAIGRLEHAADLYREAGDDRQRTAVLRSLESVFRSVTKNTEATAEQVTEAWRRLMSVLEELGDLREAAAAAQQFLAGTAEYSVERLNALLHLGLTFVKLKAYEEAIAHYDAATAVLSRLRVSSESPEWQVHECELLLGLGQAQRHVGHSAAAIASHGRAVTLAQSSANDDALWRARGNLALAQADCGEFADAIEGLTETISHFEEPRYRDMRMLGHARFNLAYAHYRQGQSDLAKQEAAEALRLLSLINDSVGVAQVLEQMNGWEATDGGQTAPGFSDLGA